MYVSPLSVSTIQTVKGRAVFFCEGRENPQGKDFILPAYENGFNRPQERFAPLFLPCFLLRWKVLRNSSAQDFAPAAKSVKMRKGQSGIRPFAVRQALNGRIP